VDASDLDPDPIRQFAIWYAEAKAAGIAQPDAMALATASRDAHPSVRMVLLKGHDFRGFTFFTNHEGRKGEELAENPRAALVLHWQPLRRQVRIEGAVERLVDEEAAAYFATRPRPSQVAAWASPQSRPLGSREELERMFAEQEQRLAGLDVTLPPFWGGYRVIPDAIEFWHGRDNRLHDRIRYERAGEDWTRERLAP
jgi:pyridoxamine 5'-phosphate oxidase